MDETVKAMTLDPLRISEVNRLDKESPFSPHFFFVKTPFFLCYFITTLLKQKGGRGLRVEIKYSSNH
jgi:hypothetical protein